jgi:hypothetical protein
MWNLEYRGPLNQRLNLLVSNSELIRLDALAATNARGNRSMMIRILINIAFENAEALGMREPLPARRPACAEHADRPARAKDLTPASD